jgi:hypothetical protein
MEDIIPASTGRTVRRIGIWGSPCSGKTTFLAALLHVAGATGPSAARSLQRDSAELDKMLDVLVSDEAFPFPQYSVTIATAPDYRMGPADLPAVARLTATSAITPIGAADHPWASSLDLSFSVVSLPPSGQLIPLDRGRRTQLDADEPVVFIPDWRLSGFVLAIEAVLLRYSRRGLLYLIYGIRMILYLRLVRVLSGLFGRPDAISLVLRLLAASRCFGYRTDSGDYVPPFLTSMSVVIGEAALLR